MKDLAKKQDFRSIFKKKKHLEENQEEVHEGLRRKWTLEASQRCQALGRKVRRSSRRPTPFYSLSLSLCLSLSSETSWRLSKPKTSLEDTRIIKSEDSSSLPKIQSRHHQGESYKSVDEAWKTNYNFLSIFSLFPNLVF